MNASNAPNEVISRLKVGSPARLGGLQLYPVLESATTSAESSRRYLLYQQAHDLGLVSIGEVSDGGSVGQLRVENRAAQPVLLVEGEVLLGMKQTRVLNLTILVPAGSVLDVPVSCVEAGRWRSVSPSALGKGEIHLAPSIRAAKTVTVARSMRTMGSFASDQAAVWAGVDDVLESYDSQSPTRSYADLLAEELALSARAGQTSQPAQGQVGIIACIRGRIACMDSFESPQALAALWDGLVLSYQAEAFISDEVVSKPPRVRQWFRSIGRGSASIGPDLGLGTHVTVVAPGVEAAALFHDGRVLHLSAFPAHEATSVARFAQPNRRRS